MVSCIRRLGRRRPGCRSTPGIRSQDCGVGAHGWPPSARNRVAKGGSEKRTAAEKREYIRHCRPRGVSIAEGCRLMGIGRSTFYDTPDVRTRDLTIVAEMKTICDEFEAYGYRRVDAELRHRGIVVNAKKIRRLMREHALNPKQRRRFVATTDSDHNYPIFPNLAKNMKLGGPNQLWVADITYVTIATGLVYLAAILDAWSRRVVGYAISRSIDARLAVAALKEAWSSLTSKIWTPSLDPATRASGVCEISLSSISGSCRYHSTKVVDGLCTATARKAFPSRRKRLPNFASQRRTAFASMASNTGSSSPGELLMT